MADRAAIAGAYTPRAAGGEAPGHESSRSSGIGRNVGMLRRAAWICSSLIAACGGDADGGPPMVDEASGGHSSESGKPTADGDDDDDGSSTGSGEDASDGDADGSQADTETSADSGETGHIDAWQVDVRELPAFAQLPRSRVGDKAMMPSGREMLFVLDEEGIDRSLGGWLTAYDPEAVQPAGVSIYDIERDQVFELVRGEVDIDGEGRLLAYDFGFSLDVASAHDEVVVAFHRGTMAYEQEQPLRLTVESIIARLDSTGGLSEMLRIETGSLPEHRVPLQLAGDGSQLALIAAPAGEESSMWGIDMRESDPHQLYVLEIEDSPELKLISQPDARVPEFLDPIATAFDMSYDGRRIIYQDAGSGRVVTLDSDGAGRRTIFEVSSRQQAQVAVSGDGRRVILADWRAPRDEADIDPSGDQILMADFDGTRMEIVLEGELHHSGDFRLDETGAALVFSDHHAHELGPPLVTPTAYFLALEGHPGMFPLMLRSGTVRSVSPDLRRVIMADPDTSATYLLTISEG